MTVEANFQYVVTSGTIGVNPFTVAFTDTSTGSPTAWKWDFGDGNTSLEQNPIHTFTADGFPEVTLTAFKKTTPTTVNGVFNSGRYKQGSGTTAVNAHNNFTAASWTNTPPGSNGLQYLLTFTTSYQLRAEEYTLDYNLASLSGNYGELQIFFGSATNPPGTKVNTDGGEIIDPGVKGVWIPVRDVTGDLGGSIQVSWFGDNYIYGGWDYIASGNRVAAYTITDTDTVIKTLTALTCNFVGIPVYGTNIQSVQFTDLSDAGVTAWSWRRRKAGTNDAFVEFSTVQNPAQDFDKNNP